MSGLTQDKLDESWRLVRRQIRAAELLEEFATLRQSFERVVDSKDKAINLLKSELKEREEQQFSARHHCLKRLLQVQNDRQAALDSHWNASLEEFGNNICTERVRLLKLHEREAECLKAETLALEQKYDEIYRETRAKYRSNIDDRHAIKSTEEMLDQSKVEELQTHKEATEEQRVKELNAVEALLRFDMADDEATAERLRAECEQMTQNIRQLRDKLSSDQAAKRARLIRHTSKMGKAISQLQETVEIGEAVLQKADLCRKLETEQEKVLPLYIASLNSEELSQETEHATESMPEELAQAMTKFVDLEKFCQRFNKVRLERLNLQHEKKVVEEEKKQLRTVLEQHLDGKIIDKLLQ